MLLYLRTAPARSAAITLHLLHYRVAGNAGIGIGDLQGQRSLKQYVQRLLPGCQRHSDSRSWR